ncbi:hypothetical protein [Methylophaga sp.]|uniref:hypothetical protein n=1 Tax=Methylophaga sp. TaxID=2024840 RepID=UPI001759AEED|nr:hypothetical protein [Methylophaga sp.]HIC47836.1 hypothetical protein [Methylophaga sp.]
MPELTVAAGLVQLKPVGADVVGHPEPQRMGLVAHQRRQFLKRDIPHPEAGRLERLQRMHQQRQRLALEQVLAPFG